MALAEIKVPSPGESITEVQIARWLKKDRDYVDKDEAICEIDSDKATLTLNSEFAGAIKILVKEGETVAVGSVVCTIDTSVSAPAKKMKEESSVAKKSLVKENVVPEPDSYAKGIPSVAADKIIREKGISPSQVTPTGKGGRITKADVMNISPAPARAAKGGRTERREPMSMRPNSTSLWPHSLTTLGSSRGAAHSSEI